MKTSSQQYLSYVNGEFRTHPTMEDARLYELQCLGFSSWSSERRRVRFSIPRPLLKGILSAIVIQSLLFTVCLVIFMIAALSSCAPAKKFNDPQVMRQHAKEMKHVGRI